MCYKWLISCFISFISLLSFPDKRIRINCVIIWKLCKWIKRKEMTLRAVQTGKGFEKMWKTLLSLLHLVGVVLFRIDSLPQLPGLWAIGAVAVVTRKVEQVGWWSQGEVNNIVTANLQSCLELVAVCPPGFSAVTHLAHTKFRSNIYWSPACLLITCYVVFVLTLLQSFQLSARWNPDCCSGCINFTVLIQDALCVCVRAHDGEGCWFLLPCEGLLFRLLPGVPLLLSLRFKD